MCFLSVYSPFNQSCRGGDEPGFGMGEMKQENRPWKRRLVNYSRSVGVITVG